MEGIDKKELIKKLTHIRETINIIQNMLKRDKRNFDQEISQALDAKQGISEVLFELTGDDFYKNKQEGKMTLKDFIEKYKGKAVDFDGKFGAQCVDLARQYFKDVWELSQQPEPVIGAQDFFFKHDSRPIQSRYCDCTLYHDAQEPPPVGAVVIFKSSGNNQYGHIGICIEANKKLMLVFEQDGIANEKALKDGKEQKGAYIGTWGYDRLVGWLTKKEGV